MLKFRRSNTAAQPGELLPPLPNGSSRKGPSAGGSKNLDRKCSFVSSQLGHSQSTILVRNLSLPLAWPVEEYFGTKKDWREFTVQLAIRSSHGGPQQFSKPVERINRTYTDVDFPDEFLFADQEPEFCIELSVFCIRSDDGAGTSAGSMVQTISRSLGRSIGHSWRRYLDEQKKLDQRKENSGATMAFGGGSGEEGAPNRSFLEELRRAGLREEQRQRAGNGAQNLSPSSSTFSGTFDEHFGRSDQTAWLPPSFSPNGMCPIGIARFRLRNATLSGKTHSYTLERLPPPAGLAKSHLLPIYGNICAQILVQPSSLVSPLAQGSLDIFLSDAGILHQHLLCTLQGGQLRCWETAKRPSSPSTADPKVNPAHGNERNAPMPKLPPLLCLQIGQNIRLEGTAFPTAFRLIFDENEAQNAKGGDGIVGQLLCICPTQRALIGWKNAIKLQQIDTEIWPEFALTQRNPHAAALGMLPGMGPAPFQHLSAQMDEENVGGFGENRKMATLCVPSEKLLEMGKIAGAEMIRPRACSSASVIARNGDLHQMASLNEERKENALAAGEKRRLAPSGPSRTTLVDAQEANFTLSPSPPQIPRRKLSPPSASSSLSPQSGLLRRLTQQKAAAANRGAERHISWSLGHGASSAGNKPRGNARQLFQPEEHGPMPESPPSKKASEERPPIQFNAHSFSDHQRPQIAPQKQQNEAIKIRQMPGNGPRPFVLSLRIDPDERKPSKEPPSKNAQFPLKTMPTIPGSPVAVKRMENAPAIGQIHQTSNSPPQRPFNVNLDFEGGGGGGPPSTADAGRWARAQIGRSETWHFARTSQACTRL